MALSRDENRLPCGVELDSILEQVTEGAPPPAPAHQASCPYCQTAMSGFHQGWRDLRTMADEPVPIPPGVAARIMTRVRALARRTLENVILVGSGGHTQIAHAVIAQVARRAALAVPGVVFAYVQPAPPDSGDPTRISLTIRLVATYGPKLGPLAAGLRARLQRRVLHLTGARVDAIDITVIDLAWPAAEGTERT
jgi:uncharacterized alkaline shock family protein YloU